MQGDAGRLDAALLQRCQHGLIKMQGRCGRCSGTWLAGKHRLVAPLVVAGFGLNVGRQRHMPVALHEQHRVVAEPQVKQLPFRIRPAAQQGGRKAACHVQHRAHCGSLADLKVRGHLKLGQGALHQQLQRTARGFFTKQARLDHAGVVEHQQIAPLQQTGQVAKNSIVRRFTPPIQQARRTSLGSRVLGNALGREVEVKVGKGEFAGGDEGCHGYGRGFDTRCMVRQEQEAF